MLGVRAITVLATSVEAGLVTVEMVELEGAPGIWCVIVVERNTSERNKQLLGKRYITTITHPSLEMHIISKYCILETLQSHKGYI